MIELDGYWQRIRDRVEQRATEIDEVGILPKHGLENDEKRGPRRREFSSWEASSSLDCRQEKYESCIQKQV